jgi:hypothetical protein
MSTKFNNAVVCVLLVAGLFLCFPPMSQAAPVLDDPLQGATLGKTKISFATADVGGTIEIDGASMKFTNKIVAEPTYPTRHLLHPSCRNRPYVPLVPDRLFRYLLGELGWTISNPKTDLSR